jgi:hypothetical protein
VRGDALDFLVHILERAGWKVRVASLISEDQYRALSRGGRWRRLYLRCLMYLAYPARLKAAALLAPRTCVFVVTSNNFFAPPLVALLRRARGGATVHLLYDLFPDALSVAGKLRENTLLFRALGRVSSCAQRWCAATVYLGAFLRHHAETRWGAPKRSAVIAYSAAVPTPAAAEPAPWRGPPTFHYGGQLGHMHAADELAAALRLTCAARSGAPPPFQFYLSGAKAAAFQREVADLPVEVNPAVPPGQWRAIARASQVGLVSLLPGGATVCMPSKTYGMMAQGLAILAICPRWSDLGQLVLEHECGWLVENSPHAEAPAGDAPDYLERTRARRPVEAVAEDFRAVVEAIVADPAELLRRRANAVRAMRSAYSVEALALSWRRILDQARGEAEN